MHTVTAVVPRDTDACWRAFTDASQLTEWVPGLRSAEILTKARGLPAEIHFEFGGAHAYTLVYAYDRDAREVRWQPKLGKQAGVTGFAKFEPVPDGTRVTYGLEHGDARGAAERELGDVQRLIEAFISWMGAR